jgi:hypothetical protein
LSIKSLSTKRANKVKPLKEEDVMTENNQDMVDKPNPSSEKKLKLPKKSHSDCNATPASKEELSLSAEPRVSY